MILNILRLISYIGKLIPVRSLCNSTQECKAVIPSSINLTYINHSLQAVHSNPQQAMVIIKQGPSIRRLKLSDIPRSMYKSAVQELRFVGGCPHCKLAREIDCPQARQGQCQLA